MKAFKKLFSIVLAVAMILSMSVTAFASENNEPNPTTPTGQITIMNPGEESYRAYKIFDAKTENGEVQYTITDLTGTGDLFDVVYDTTNSTSNIPGLVFTKVGETDKYVVTMEPGFTAESFATYLKDHIAQDPTDMGITFTDGSTPANLADGYYLVVANDGQADQDRAMLATVLNGQEVKIQNKNDMPLDKTVDDEKYEGATVGQVVNFKIKGKVPSVDADDTFYAYYVSDIMSEGLEFVTGSFKVWIDKDGDGVCDEETAVNEAEEITLSEITSAAAILKDDQVRFGANGKTFELSLDMLNRGKATDNEHPEYEGLAGNDIYIEYQATVTEDAFAVLNENHAVLEYGNNPSELEIKDSKAWVYVARIIIDKFESSNPTQKLAGAEFVLYRKETTGTGDNQVTTKYYYKEGYKTISDITGLTDGTDYVTEDNVNYALANGAKIPEIQWIEDINQATRKITDEDGAAYFVIDEDGTYYVEETAAPVDYVKLDAPVEVKVESEKCMTPGLTEEQIARVLNNVVNVGNTIGTNLPSTGGIGTTIFYVLGAILVIAGGVVLVTRRRMSA